MKKLPEKTCGFIEKAKKVHGEKYDYSQTEYTKVHDKVKIICPKHGEFLQEANSHLHGCGCPKCKLDNASKKYALSREEIIKRTKQIHGNKYDLTLIEDNIKNCHQKITIRCIKHDFIFKISVCHLLEGHGCRKCANEKLYDLRAYTTTDFQECLDNKFGKIYKVLTPYTNNHTKVKCKCTLCNNIFERIPSAILNGVGCTYCYSSKLELSISKFLYQNNIYFELLKRFDWLGKKSLDFYLPEQNIAIECLGMLHFILKNFFGGSLGLKVIQKRDEEKRRLCEKKWNQIIILL